jgi:hypothetical protein
MRRRLTRWLALMMVIILALPMLPAIKVNAATKASLSMSSKTLVGVGATVSLSLKNVKTANVKRATWYTQNEDVAIVDVKTGKVTAVGKGTTKIKCKITYKDGKVERPYCKVTVKIPATAVTINNAKDTEENNNRHVITIGESYDFNASLTPSDANDQVYWFVDNQNFASVDKNGVVTGLKPGIVRLTAKASLTASGAAKSQVDYGINIEIVSKTARVISTVLTDTTTLVVNFSNPIDASTIIGTNGKLLDNIVITAKTDDSGATANGLGTLTGSLSTDGKTLTIKSTNTFNGSYAIHFLSNIKTTDGIALLDYYENLNLKDNTKPSFVNWTVDDTGLVVSLNFSEVMDFSGLVVTDPKVVTTGQTALTSTLTMISLKDNYVPSKDGKSLTIDLSNMPSVDRNKMFAINLSGIKDKAGNYPAAYPLTVYLMADTTARPQARIITIARSGYNTLTATFDRAIKTPGRALLSNGEWLQGVVDPTDNKKVNFTLSATAALLTGIQKVSIGYWDGYNVSPSDTSAGVLISYNIDFTTDRTVPVLMKSELTTITENNVDSFALVLTYNKAVTLINGTGSFISKLVTSSNDIYSNKILNYTAIAKENVVTVILNSSQITDSGVYTITIPTGFVRDSYNNLSMENTVQVKKDGGSSTALPAPKGIAQSPDNASVVFVSFGQKVDEATAQNVTNYSITGVIITSAELIDNTPTGATVKLNILQGSIASTTIYPITITGITGYHNSYTVMDRYQTIIPLTENKAPGFVSITYKYPYTITLTYDEAIKGTTNYKVYQGSTEIVCSSVINGNTVVITLNSLPIINTPLQVSPTQYNSITDTLGNIAINDSKFVTPVVN